MKENRTYKLGALMKKRIIVSRLVSLLRDVTLTCEDKDLGKFNKVSLSVCKQAGFLTEYTEIEAFLNELKQIEFEGKDIDDDFSKFYALANKIKKILIKSIVF